jgi:putative DNA primase/helicase
MSDDPQARCPTSGTDDAANDLELDEIEEAEAEEAAHARSGNDAAVPLDAEAEIQRLAALPEVEAARQFKAVAAQLGDISATSLRGLVKRARSDARKAEKDARTQKAAEEKAVADAAKADAAAKKKADAKAAADKARADAKAAKDKAAAEKVQRLKDAIAARQKLQTAPDGATLPAGFTLKNGSFWYLPAPSERGIPAEFRVCDAFRIIGRTSDEGDDEHGLLLHWKSVNGVTHQWAMKKEKTHLAANELAGELQRGGLSCATSAAAHEALKHLLNNIETSHRVRSVSRAGWHGDIYLLGDGRVFGGNGKIEIVLESEHAVNVGRYASAGTLDEWKANVAQYAVGNPIIAFYLCAPFAGPLLAFVDDTSEGFHFHGGSRSGKTTCSCCKASVQGPGTETGSAIYSWRSTTNSLEIIAAEHNDGSFDLDEMGLASARQVSDAAYMLGSGQGKGRSDAKGHARPIQTWRVIYFSSGEIDMKAKLAEDGKMLRPGQELRLLQIPVSGKYGVFDDLHGEISGGVFSDRLRRNAATYYGTAMPAFLGALVAERNRDPLALQAKLSQGRAQFLTENLPQDADGQVRSTCLRFATLACAGELARRLGVLPWPKGEAWKAASKCFAAWLADRGESGKPREEKLRREQVQSFYARWGASRFVRLVRRAQAPDDEVDRPEQQVRDCAGFLKKKGSGDGHEFWTYPTVWNDEVCAGFKPADVNHQGIREKWLIPDSEGRSSQSVRAGEHGTLRLYIVDEELLFGYEPPQTT